MVFGGDRLDYLVSLVCLEVVFEILKRYDSKNIKVLIVVYLKLRLYSCCKDEVKVEFCISGDV